MNTAAIFMSVIVISIAVNADYAAKRKREPAEQVREVRHQWRGFPPRRRQRGDQLHGQAAATSSPKRAPPCQRPRTQICRVRVARTAGAKETASRGRYSSSVMGLVGGGKPRNSCRARLMLYFT